MNQQATVTGMQVKTQVSDNLFVAPIALSSATKNTESSFKPAHNFTLEAALLEPVSTVDGKNFFYTDSSTNVSTDGSVIEDDQYVALNTGAADPTSDQLTAFRNANGVNTSVGFVDYVFELKAINTDTSAKALNLTNINLIYNGVPVAEQAFRVAIFMQKYNEGYTMVSSATLPAALSILAKSGADYFTDNQAVNGTDSLAAVTLGTNVTWNVTAQSTEYFKVVVRIWLEGEDESCNNSTFASLNQNWSLDIKFVLGSGSPVTLIGNTPIAASTSGLTGTVTVSEGKLSNGEAPAAAAAYQWYTKEGAAIGGATSASYTASEEAYVYCKIVTNKGNVYYTDCLHLVA